MATPDIEDVRRLARELERKEQRGGDGFSSFLDFIDEFEDIGWLFFAVAVSIGLSIYLGSFAPLIYLAMICAAALVLALAWMIVEPIFEFVMDHLEDLKEAVAVLPGFLLGIGMFVSSLSQGKNPLEAFVLAFISFALISGLTRLAFGCWSWRWNIGVGLW